jgi:hypothetical protein
MIAELWIGNIVQDSSTWIIWGNMSLYTWWPWRRQWHSKPAYIEAHIWNRYVRNTLKVLKCCTAEGCRWSVGPIMWRIQKYGRTPLIRTLVTRIANYPDRLGLWGEFVKNSTKLTCVEIAGCVIKYSIVLWLLEPQIRRGRKVYTQVRAVIIIAELQTAKVANFQRKIQLSGRMAGRPN